MPTKKELINNLAESAKTLFKTGLTTAEIREERMSLCKQCPSFHDGYYSCNECGCLLMMKTAVKGACCPLGVWGPYEG